MLSIGAVAKMLGVSVNTLRRWDAMGKLTAKWRTIGNHRRYDIDDIRSATGEASSENGLTIAYARVSYHDQKDDLVRQSEFLSAYCRDHGWHHDVITDLGSGLNYKKPGLQRLLKLICQRCITRLVIADKDRLLRFGSEIVFALCRLCGVQVIVVNHNQTEDANASLAKDVLEILTVFSAKLYGQRSHRNRQRTLTT
jgi:predicted site-specific integrase-resolvase